MSVEKVPFTKEGYERLSKELDRLKSVERPKVISDIAEARAHGDLSENAEYSAAKEHQGIIEARIADLEDKIGRANVVDFTNDPSDRVRFSAWVTVEDETTGDEKSYRIVSDLEADLENGLISISSPIARALMGKSVDDVVEVHAPKGKIEYLITGVRY